MSGFNKVINNSCDDIRDRIFTIQKLAKSFYNIGNEELGNRLSDIAESIEESLQEMQKAAIQELSNQVKQSGQMTGVVLEATMAGIKLAEDEAQESK